MKYFDLTGKTALLTGGTGALGVAMASGLVAAGCQIALLSRKQENLTAAAERISRATGVSKDDILLLPGDVIDRKSLVEARAVLEKQWGRLDILVNAAGGNQKGATITPDQSFFDLDMDAFSRVNRLNLDGTVLPSLVFGELMRKNERGCVVNISSMAAERAITRVVGYSTAKAGIDNFTKWLAVEFAKKFDAKIRVNAIAPGFFIGEQNRALLLKEEGGLTDRGNTIIANTPAGRFGEADELITTLIYLCADASSFVTGIVVPVDGGFSAFSGV